MFASCWMVLPLVGLLAGFAHAQNFGINNLASATSNVLGASNNLLQSSNDLITTNSLNQAIQNAQQAQQATLESQFAIERTNAANRAAALAERMLLSEQADATARMRLEEFRALQQEVQRQQAEEAARELARSKVAAKQAIINAQQAIKDAREKEGDAEMVFRGLFPGQCSGRGMYYHDAASYYICDGLQHHLHRCPSGFRTGELNSYTLGKIYNGNSFCNQRFVPEVKKRAKVVRSRSHVGFSGQGPLDPVFNAHSAVPLIHADGYRGRHPKAMTVTTQSHSQRHGGVTHTVQKHVRTVSDGRSYNGKQFADHSLGGVSGGAGKQDVNNGPVYHYHYYYDGKKVRSGHGSHQEGHFSQGQGHDYGLHGARFNGYSDSNHGVGSYDGPGPYHGGPGPYHGGPGPYHDGPRRFDGPGPMFHGLLPRF